MHPQIRQDKPGKCPICGMDLIPLKKNVISGGDAVSDPDAIRLSDEAMALADVQTTRVSRSNPVKQVRLYGKIIPDERSLQSQTAYVADVLNGLTSSSPARPYVPGRHLLLFIRLNFHRAAGIARSGPYAATRSCTGCPRETPPLELDGCPDRRYPIFRPGVSYGRD